MKATFHIKEGQHICKTNTLGYFTRERAVRLAIRRGHATLQSTDERGQVQDLTHILQNRVLSHPTK